MLHSQIATHDRIHLLDLYQARLHGFVERYEQRFQSGRFYRNFVAPHI